MRFEGKVYEASSVASYRSWDAYRAWILHRSGFDDDTEGGEEIGRRDDVAYYPTEHLSPQVAGFTSLVSLRSFESVWKPARTPPRAASVSRLNNYTSSTYYPPLNYSLLTTKIAPCHPYFSSHGFLVFSRLRTGVTGHGHRPNRIDSIFYAVSGWWFFFRKFIC